LVELGDRKGLDEIFGRILTQPKDVDRDFYYIALMNYADGLARFSDDRAWSYFEEAIDFHPENNLEAINRYAQHLLTRGLAQKAFEVLDTRLTSEQRVVFGLPAFLRKAAAEQAGLDTASADEEVARIKQLLDEGPLIGASLTEGTQLDLDMDSQPLTEGAEMMVKAITADSRVSAIFAIGASANWVRQDAIFSPNGAMNNRWPIMSPSTTAKKLATLKWPNSNRVGLVRIGTDNRVYYRYFNGSSWNSWSGLSVLPNNHSAIDIAAVVYANSQADIFAVVNDNCTIYSSRSTNGTTWGAWQWWGACGDNITAAIMPDGTGFAAIRATQAGNQAAVRYFNGSTWAGSWTGIGGIVNDLALLAYANPAQIGGIRMGLSAVGSDNCRVYGNNWNGSSWSGWFSVASCYKQVSAFNTSDGGAYMLFIHRDTGYLHTQRFTGSAWAGIVPQPQGGGWVAAVGANIDDETGNAYEHTEYSDDCRVAENCSKSWSDSLAYYYTMTINLAEIIFNEAQGETRGAQAAVGWVVRNRVFQGVSCDVYVGGINYRTTCSSLPCSDPRSQFQDYSRWYCCAMHGAQTLWGTSGYQFNDEHVDFGTLSNAGLPWLALWLLNGRIPEMSTNFVPDGVPRADCTLGCGTNPHTPTSPPWCNTGLNITQPSGKGPMEFQDHAYTPAASSCKQAPTVNTCQGAANNFVCCNASPNNYFWNRKP
jgi:hypothetical protein